MILPYNYWYFASAIPESVCDTIIDLGLETMHQAKQNYGEDAVMATTGDWKQKQPLENVTETISDNTIEHLVSNGKSLDDVYVRDSNVAWLNDPWLYNMIWPHIRQANKLAGWNFDWDFTEDLQFTKYGVDQFYGWHADAGPEPYTSFDPDFHKFKLNNDGTPLRTSDGSLVPEAAHLSENPQMLGKIRKLSVTISLSDPKDYDGGNLKFDLGPHREDRYHECVEIRPRGSIIVFPSHVYHQVTPVTRGTRYSLVAWNLGYPFK
jgi:PKHD-type hydroxylase